MHASSSPPPQAGFGRSLSTWLMTAVLAVAVVVTLASLNRLPGPLQQWVMRSLHVISLVPPAPPAQDDHDHDDHDHDHDGGDHDHGDHDHPHDDHDHEGHTDENAIELSPQARRSIGLTEGDVAISDFQRTITVPGMVVERPGWSRLTSIAPITGYLTAIHITAGQAVAPNQPLFEVRLTHEELVQAQSALLRTNAEIDVVNREIERLKGIGPEGLIPSKRIIEQEYELQKLGAVLQAERQALMLHGLTEEQINRIVSTRTLLQSIEVRAPQATDDGSRVLIVQDLPVDRGQHVTIGDTLAVLADHGTLLVEGEAFEQDVAEITAAALESTPLTAVFDAANGQEQRLDDLRITYVADQIATDSRTLHFYVTLPNELAGTPIGTGPRRYVSWRYKPGQRMLLRVPVETWKDQIVLPADAVAREGVENYVFLSKGDHFDRQPVSIVYRDPEQVVIPNDGTLPPGTRVAMSAAQQLQLALKNTTGGGVDPHAGHTH